jgi:cyclic 2,3-diphosphoglycerate synthetase
MRAIALVDGEHYPPVIRHALDTLRDAEGFEFVAAVFLGGTEKLKSDNALDQLGVPVVRPGVVARCRAGAG